jgi:hypothetical protein
MGAQRIIPMHWQPLVEQVPFRYQSSDLVKLAKASGTSVQVCALAIGEKLEQESGGLPHRPPSGKSFPHSAAAP